MELRHLRYFVAVAEDLNFTKAARRIRVAQPALSAQIRVLEDELGAPLFHRSTRAVQLSAVGVQLLPKALEVLAKAGEAEWTAKRAARGEIGRLTVGFITASGTPTFHRILRRFRAALPEVELEILDMPSGPQIRALRDGFTDVGFLRPPVDASLFDHEAFTTDRMVLAVPAGHRLATRRTVRWEQLRDEPLIMLPPELNPSFHDAFLRECRRNGISPKVAQHANEVPTLLSLVAGGHGIAPVMGAVGARGVSGVTLRRFDPPGPELETFMVWPRLRASPLALRFVELAREVLREQPGSVRPG
jgi:DNA-binding transcriptional LysR family regulator